jgi:hypothetical protein
MQKRVKESDVISDHFSRAPTGRFVVPQYKQTVRYFPAVKNNTLLFLILQVPGSNLGQGTQCLCCNQHYQPKAEQQVKISHCSSFAASMKFSSRGAMRSINVEVAKKQLLIHWPAADTWVVAWPLRIAVRQQDELSGTGRCHYEILSLLITWYLSQGAETWRRPPPNTVIQGLNSAKWDGNIMSCTEGFWRRRHWTISKVYLRILLEGLNETMIIFTQDTG